MRQGSNIELWLPLSNVKTQKRKQPINFFEEKIINRK